MPIRHVLLPSPAGAYSSANAVADALSIDSDTLQGRGCFAVVYEHPMYPDKVIKIVRFRDQSYNAYVRAVLRLQARKPCPWLPYIYEAVMFHVYNDVMIKTKYIRERVHSRVLVVVLDKLVGDINGKLNAGQRAVIDSLLAKRIDNADAIVSRFSYLATCAYAKRQLLRAQKAIKWALHHGGSVIDLHWGNVMFQPKTGQLIFTDPIA